MSRLVVLDSTPLALLVQPPGYKAADECRDWLKRHLAAGVQLIVPAIVNYELRRELLRLGKTASLNTLDAFVAAAPGRYVPLDEPALRLAAELWARVRRQGKPTADPQALDIDVILAAQVLSAGHKPADFVVATSNVGHLSLLVPAQQWNTI